MTRQEILDQYEVSADGIIRSPGKFEGEMLYAPYYYDHGQGDETWTSGASEDAFAEVFRVTSEDQREFPELGRTILVAVEEDDQGFVRLTEWSNQREARKAQRHYERGENPGTRWHGREATRAETARKGSESRGSIIGSHYYRGKRDAHRESQEESRRIGLNPSSAYDVFLRGKKIDTVFQQDPSSAEDVKRSLVQHDGYDPDIRVVKQRRKGSSQNIIAIKPTGDPYGRGWEGTQTTDGGKSWFYRGDIGARSRAWWRAYARREGASLRIENPGAAWHAEAAAEAAKLATRTPWAPGKVFFHGKMRAHQESAAESRKMGLNPEVGMTFNTKAKAIRYAKAMGKLGHVTKIVPQDYGTWRVILQETKQNPKSEADATAARELLLFIENSERLYRQMLLPMYTNLDRKRKRGTYDREKAVKLFLYLADEGARHYNQEVMGQKGIPAFFTRATRLLVARDLRDRYETEERDFPRPNPRGARTVVGKVFRAKRWAKRWARGRPVHRVKGGWQVGAGRKRTRAQELAHRRMKGNPRRTLTWKDKGAAALSGRLYKLEKNPIAVYNPPAGKIIYGRVLAVEAQKTNGSYRGKRFRHSFEKDSRVVAYAMPDGSVLLRSAAGKRLWQDR